jgi:hypothetical protein
VEVVTTLGDLADLWIAVANLLIESFDAHGDLLAAQIEGAKLLRQAGHVRPHGLEIGIPPGKHTAALFSGTRTLAVHARALASSDCKSDASCRSCSAWLRKDSARARSREASSSSWLRFDW